MNRLLGVLLAFSLFGCSGSTDPESGTKHKIPKVGSTFTMRFTYEIFDTSTVHRVMITGLRYDGKSNVLMTEDSVRIAYEDNGDISIPHGDNGNWIRIPVVSKRDTVLVQERADLQDGSYLTFEQQVNFLNEKTMVIEGKNYESLRFEIREIYKSFDAEGVLVYSDVKVLRIGWIPEIGYLGLTEREIYNNVATQQLIAFELK